MLEALANTSEVFTAWQEAKRRGNDRSITEASAEPHIMEADRLAHRLAEGPGVFGRTASAAEVCMKAQVARYEMATNDTGLVAALLESIIYDLGKLAHREGKHAC